MQPKNHSLGSEAFSLILRIYLVSPGKCCMRHTPCHCAHYLLISRAFLCMFGFYFPRMSRYYIREDTLKFYPNLSHLPATLCHRTWHWQELGFLFCEFNWCNLPDNTKSKFELLRFLSWTRQVSQVALLLTTWQIYMDLGISSSLLQFLHRPVYFRFLGCTFRRRLDRHHDGLLSTGITLDL